MKALGKAEKKVLGSLLADGRRPYSKIAKDNKLTRQTVHNVIRRLYESGVIRKFGVQADTERLGLDLKVYSLLSLSRRDNAKQVEKTLSYMKEVSQIHRILGPHDYILEITVPSRASLTALFDRIGELPDVEKMESLLVFKTVKYAPDDPVRQVLD